MGQGTRSSGSLAPTPAGSRSWEVEANAALNSAFRLANGVNESFPEPLVRPPSTNRGRLPAARLWRLSQRRRVQYSEALLEPSTPHESRPLETFHSDHSRRTSTTSPQTDASSGQSLAPPFVDTSDEGSTCNAKSPYSGLLSRPSFYLRRIVLVAFILCFAALAVTIQALLAFSNQNQGLAKSDANLHFAFKYGPTLVLTVVAALWSRVEFQAQMDAPWRRLARGPISAEKSLLLDYQDYFAPKALWKALANHDWAVALSMAVTFLLTGTMLLSTTLLNPTAVPLSVPFPVKLQNAFAGNWSRLINTESESIELNILNLVNNVTNYPEGTLSNMAYPRFRPGSDTRLDYHFTSNGLIFNVPCQSANLVSFVVSIPGTDEQDTVWTATLQSDECDTSLRISDGYASNTTKYLNLCRQGSCQGQTVLWVANVEVDAHSMLPLRSSQIICFPSYHTSQMDVSAFGGNLKNIVPRQEDKGELLTNVTVGDFTTVLLGWELTTCFGFEDIVPELCSLRTTLGVWAIVGALFDSIHPSIDSMFNTSMLQRFTTRGFEQVFVLLASNSLTEPAESTIQGIASSTEDRVFVQSVSAHVMTGLLATSVLLACSLIAIARPDSRVPKYPTSVVDLGALFCHPSSKALLTKLSGHCCASEALAGLELQSVLEVESTPKPCAGRKGVPRCSAYYVEAPRTPTTTPGNSDESPPPKSRSGPAMLLIAFRLAIALSTLAVLIALEVSLRNSENGLAIASQSQAWNYLWQLVPAAILTLIRFYHSAVDFNIRALQPFHHMKQGKESNLLAKLNLLDKSLPSIIGTEVHSGSFAPLSTTVSRFIASFLTIASASLFYSKSTLSISKSQLRAEDGFNIIPGVYDSKVDRLTDLIFEGNMTYPQFTFEDLVFPGLTVTESQFATGVEPNMLEYASTIPALHPNLNCKLYDATPNISMGFDEGSKPENFTIEIGQCTFEQTFPKCDVSKLDVYLGQWILQFDQRRICYPEMEPYPLIFLWGMIACGDLDRSVASVLVCNETLEEVDVDVSFFGPELGIDPALPPTIQSGSAKTSALEINRAYHDYLSLFTSVIPQPENPPGAFLMLGDPFILFMSSRFGLSYADFGNASHAQATADAIQFQFRVLRAQAINIDQRVSMPRDVNSTASLETWPSNSAALYSVTVRDNKGQERVFQDSTSTRILQALLGTILVLSVLSWVMMPRAGTLLPHSATNLGETLAMLARGNVWEFLPEEAQKMDKRGLNTIFDGCIFRLENVSTRDGELNDKGKNDETPVYAIHVVRRNEEARNESRK
ncbi:hypothetical protein F4802DRAFT_211548 [Xylaria palmicola]|nr:hypothetical protein F4802DRAFT_211548 [Xylaria palmicola]